MLIALRSILFVLYLIVTVVPWGTAVVVCSLFLNSTQLYWMCANWLRVAIWGARLICGVRWRVRGMEHLPTDKAQSVILLSKHQSTWETFAYPMLMPRPLAYVFKRELIYIPFFGWSMARLDMIHHLLTTLPYVKQERPSFDLPPRPPAADYERPPRDLFHQVPDYTSTLLH